MIIEKPISNSKVQFLDTSNRFLFKVQYEKNKDKTIDFIFTFEQGDNVIYDIFSINSSEIKNNLFNDENDLIKNTLFVKFAYEKISSEKELFSRILDAFRFFLEKDGKFVFNKHTFLRNFCGAIVGIYFEIFEKK
jgi:hypothetical protein